jgi:hypothetical protein
MLPQRREVIGGDLTGEAEGIGAGSLLALCHCIHRGEHQGGREEAREKRELAVGGHVAALCAGTTM